MGINIVDFDPARHLDAAAALLAARHARDRERDPRFPAVYEVPPACKALIQQSLSTDGIAVAALVGDEMVGFAAMSSMFTAPTNMVASFFPPRCANIDYGGHAARLGDEVEIYREMYAALSARVVPQGLFWHNVYVAALDAALQEAFVSLGFGRSATAAIRNVDPVQGTGDSTLQVHAAAAEDAQVVFSLNEELYVHHSRAPIFWPRLHETDASSHEFTMGLLDDPKANAHLIAYDKDGRALGMNTFMPPTWIAPMIAPEKTIYLYQGVVSETARGGGVGGTLLAKGVEWAREQGYEHVALHFAAPNVPGARFWLGQGFRPVEYRMTRYVDDRIAWAT